MSRLAEQGSKRKKQQTKAHTLDEKPAKPAIEYSRYSINLTKENQLTLKRFGVEAGMVSGADIIRSFIELLESDAEVRTKIIHALAVKRG